MDLHHLRRATSRYCYTVTALPDLLGVGMSPAFGIGQRALLVCTPNGNVLWDCIALIDDAAHQRIHDLGGIDVIAMSHPHFYGAHIDIADAFGARVLIPNADRQWIQRPSRRIEYFEETATPVPGLTLARIGGHFDGAAVLHWPAGSGGRGALLTGDTITVVQDRSWVSFMWSSRPSARCVSSWPVPVHGQRAPIAPNVSRLSGTDGLVQRKSSAV